MSFKFSARSHSRLVGVHRDLVAVMRLAIRRTPIDFAIIEGVRTMARQRQLVAAGASRTLNSRHLTGHAVDITPYVGTVRWDWPLFHQLAPHIKAAAHDLEIPIVWGGDWRTFKDGPHWELPRKYYP